MRGQQWASENGVPFISGIFWRKDAYLWFPETDPSGGNVVLLESLADVAFERTWDQGGISYAALPQVAVDLMTSPGRGPAEAEALIEWMEENEDAWRHPGSRPG